MKLTHKKILSVISNNLFRVFRDYEEFIPEGKLELFYGGFWTAIKLRFIMEMPAEDVAIMVSEDVDTILVLCDWFYKTTHEASTPSKNHILTQQLIKLLNYDSEFIGEQMMRKRLG